MTAWSLRQRLNAAFAVVAVMLVLLSAVAVVALVRVQRSQQEVTGPIFQAVTRGSDLLSALLDQETGVRGYVLTADPTFLQPYVAGQADEQSAAADLRRLLRGRPDEQRRLDTTLRLVADWRRVVAEPVRQQVAAGGAGSVTRAQLDESKQRFDQIRASYRSFRDGLLTVRASAYSRMRTATFTLFAVVALLVVLVVVAAALVWASVRRWVTRPLTRLGEEVSVVSGGQLGHEVEITGPTEITTLAEKVDSMRLRVVEEYAAALEARAQTQEALAVVEEQKADLERSNTELEQFAYVASHDLQEPLRKVASFCQLLEKRYGDQLDDRGHQYIEFAVDGAKRMQALINDLLAFSRVGRLSEGVDDVDLEVVLEATLRSLDALIEETGATVTHDPLPTVPGEASLLAALLQNLIGNAMKFHGDQAPRVHIGVTRQADMWEFCCQDNGIGIDPKYSEKIFVIFQRLHGRDDYSGTGIGLALSRKIVEHHGGRIWLDGDTTAPGGHGTTFRFTLPIVAPSRSSSLERGQPSTTEPDPDPDLRGASL